MKIVINRCFGGFGLSHEAIVKYAVIKGLNLISVAQKTSLVPYHYYVDEEIEDNYWSEYSLERDDPALVKIVEQMGESSWGRFAELAVVEIPDGVNWHLSEYDGIEHIAEDHRTWS